MALHIDIQPYELLFKQPAGTSRGVYTKRSIRILRLHDSATGETYLGECAPLPQLSCDPFDEAYDLRLEQFCVDYCHTGLLDYEALRSYPSMCLGLEMLHHARLSPTEALFDTPFARGEEGLPINGLIWMGTLEFMQEQIEAKLSAGFRCIKVKIGALDFEEEFALLSALRQRYSADRLQLRVDANGAFSPEEAPEKLARLSTLHLHSIEQPIRAGQWSIMSALCAHTPLPIALDEELIGVHAPTAQAELLDTIRPQYIILKPSLHGGFEGCRRWIAQAQARGIGYWLTSALESNIGLNAIAQFTATLGLKTHQGLGTGALFTNNLPSTLHCRGEYLWCK